MKKLLSVLFVLMLVLSVLTACGCEHVDKNDDGLCDECGDKFSDGKDLGDPCMHRDADDNGKCDKCGEGFTDGTDVQGGSAPTVETYLRCDKEGNADPNGGYILFGEYPQTIKADDVTVTSTQDARGYYLGSDGAYYAKITATPYSSDCAFSTGDKVEHQAVYCFKVEPIRWRILSVDGAKAFLLCDSIIANMAYQSDYYTVEEDEYLCYYTTANGAPEGTYLNNYKYSEVRAWLNAAFYENAFSEMQSDLILITEVDNSAGSTVDASNSSACENTEDKIFLLSYAEVTNSAYGFAPGRYTPDEARRMASSDYARATGVNAGYYSYPDNGNWMLRSPEDGDVYISRIGYDGMYGHHWCHLDDYGVVPALWITLSE